MNSVSILCVILSSLFMSLLGVVLFVFQGQILVPLRYFLPIPPIAVSSYVFIFNMIKNYGGLPQSVTLLVIELCKSTLAAGTIYGLITSFILLSIKILGGSGN